MVDRQKQKIKLIWHCLLINKNDAIFYRTKTRKHVKGYGYLSFARNYKKQILDKGLDASKKVVLKAGEFIGNKFADVVTKSHNDDIEKQEPVEEIIIPPEKRDEILNKSRRLL